MVHPGAVEGFVAIVQNGFQIDPRALRGVVRALAGDRVIEDDGVGHAEHQRAGRKLAQRLAHRRPCRMPTPAAFPRAGRERPGNREHASVLDGVAKAISTPSQPSAAKKSGLALG